MPKSKPAGNGKRSPKSSRSKAPARSGAVRSRWIRLLLIPYTVLFVWLMGLFDLHTLDYLKRFMDYWDNGKYVLNLLASILCVGGLLLLIFGPAHSRLLTGIALLMYLMPIWFLSTEDPSKQSLAEPYALCYEWNVYVFLFELATALWALMTVRGERSTEWVKLILALFLLTACLWPFMTWEAENYFVLFVTILPFSLLTGFVVDLVFNGFSLQALLPAAISLLYGLRAVIDEKVYLLWAIAILSLIAVIVLLVKKRSMESVGGIAALTCIMLCTAVVLYIFLREELPVVVLEARR